MLQVDLNNVKHEKYITQRKKREKDTRNEECTEKQQGESHKEIALKWKIIQLLTSPTATSLMMLHREWEGEVPSISEQTASHSNIIYLPSSDVANTEREKCRKKSLLLSFNFQALFLCVYTLYGSEHIVGTGVIN